MQANLVSVHITERHCSMRLTDHVTSNFNNNMSTVFLDIEKAFDTTWHSGLLYKLSKFEFTTSLIKLISSFFTTQIQCFGRRRSVYPKGNSSRGASRFCPIPYFVQRVYKLWPPNTWCFPSPLCRRHLSVRVRSKGEFCCQKTPAWSQLNGDLL
jgi:hypothetical protein